MNFRHCSNLAALNFKISLKYLCFGNEKWTDPKVRERKSDYWVESCTVADLGRTCRRREGPEGAKRERKMEEKGCFSQSISPLPFFSLPLFILCKISFNCTGCRRILVGQPLNLLPPQTSEYSRSTFTLFYTTKYYIFLASVIQKIDRVIHQINHFPQLTKLISLTLIHWIAI